MQLTRLRNSTLAVAVALFLVCTLGGTTAQNDDRPGGGMGAGDLDDLGEELKEFILKDRELPRWVRERNAQAKKEKAERAERAEKAKATDKPKTKTKKKVEPPPGENIDKEFEVKPPTVEETDKSKATSKPKTKTKSKVKVEPPPGEDIDKEFEVKPPTIDDSRTDGVGLERMSQLEIGNQLLRTNVAQLEELVAELRINMTELKETQWEEMKIYWRKFTEIKKEKIRCVGDLEKCAKQSKACDEDKIFLLNQNLRKCYENATALSAQLSEEETKMQSFFAGLREEVRLRERIKKGKFECLRELREYKEKVERVDAEKALAGETQDAEGVQEYLSEMTKIKEKVESCNEELESCDKHYKELRNSYIIAVDDWNDLLLELEQVQRKSEKVDKAGEAADVKKCTTQMEGFRKKLVACKEEKKKVTADRDESKELFDEAVTRWARLNDEYKALQEDCSSSKGQQPSDGQNMELSSEQIQEIIDERNNCQETLGIIREKYDSNREELDRMSNSLNELSATCTELESTHEELKVQQASDSSKVSEKSSMIDQLEGKIEVFEKQLEKVKTVIPGEVAKYKRYFLITLFCLLCLVIPLLYGFLRRLLAGLFVKTPKDVSQVKETRRGKKKKE